MSRVVGLPANIRACLFDLDGVLTHTAALHFAAWKQTFDEFLSIRSQKAGTEVVPFNQQDYLTHVDGKPRGDGVESFLASRNIHLATGAENDPPMTDTMRGLGNRKNQLVLKLMQEQGVEAFEGSRRYLTTVADLGLKRAVVSASTNAREVLESSGLAHHFDVVIDGRVAKQEGLRGKPLPDTFTFASQALGVDPPLAAVFEDALAGVRAGRDGGFGFVVGVDRAGQAAALKAGGADIVVRDLAELLEKH